MNPQETLLMYVNDMIAVERDIEEAVKGQGEDDEVKKHPQTAFLIGEIGQSTEVRLSSLRALSDSLGGGAGGVKDAVAAATGFLAGLYGKIRKHPVSRMLRDDYTALALTATAYSMLYTAAAALGHEAVALVAKRHLDEVTPLIMKLSQLIPEAVVDELSLEFPNVNRNAIEGGRTVTRNAWSREG